jgi:preprotein translocase subunit SecY
VVSGFLFVLIIFFGYFYSTIQYNPIEMANNLRKNKRRNPGIRPGKPTSDYIFKVLMRLTLIGVLMLSVVALLPIIWSLICDATIPPLTEGGNDGGFSVTLGGNINHHYVRCCS